MNHTPKDYINIIRFKIVGTLAIFLAVSAGEYLALQHCRTLHTLMLLAIAYVLLWAVTARTLIDNFRELRKWKKMLVLAISLALSSWFCLPSQAMVALPPDMPESSTTQPLVIDTASAHYSVLNSTQDQTAPKFTLCEALGALIVVGAGTIIVVGIYKCAKKCLYPPTNSPPTNCPPSTKSPQRLGPQGIPSIVADNSSIFWDSTVSSNGWIDWKGLPITGSFGGVITNMTNSDGTLLAYHSSPNLLKWTPEYLCVTGWVSETPMGTNVTTIVYDEMGTPFSTNWTTYPENANITSVPIRSNYPTLFFKVSP